MKLRYVIAMLCVVLITACSPTAETEVKVSKEIDFIINMPNTEAEFQDGLLAGTNNKSQSVLINYSGETATVFDDNIRTHGDLREGLISINDNNTGLGGYADAEGKIVIPCQFSSTDRFSEGLAYVTMVDGKCGFVNKSGEMVIEGLEKYKGCYPFSEGYSIFIAENGKLGFIDINGDVAIEPIYDSARDFQNGLACVGVGGYWGAINKDGTLEFPLEYTEPVVFSGGLAITKIKNKTVVLNQSGETICSVDYKAVTGFFSEGLACVSDKGKIGYIDTAGELVIPFGEYTIGNDFKDGYALVGIDDDHCGYINKNGEAVTPMDYLFISGDFNENHALAVIDVENYKSVIIEAK